MIDTLKKLWYWGIIIGLIILGVAIYAAFGRGSDIQSLFNLRPQRTPGGKKEKTPEKPAIVDFVEQYKKKLKTLK